MGLDPRRLKMFHVKHSRPPWAGRWDMSGVGDRAGAPGRTGWTAKSPRRNGPGPLNDRDHSQGHLIAMDAFDVIVIGGGHAGAEAAAAAARFGARTALITHKLSTIGEMSCNPAIGGLGKGHLVREVDALDGVMGRAADRAGIQFRMLNRSKGPAVRGPRTQADRALYRQAVQSILSEYERLTVIEDGVEDLIVDNNQVAGVLGQSGRSWKARAVVVTTGTFLKGLIHIGEKRIPAGRVGEAPAIGLSNRLYGLGLRMGRLKTGTPARLDSKTIDWTGIDMQAADDEPIPFSFLTTKITVPQIACGIIQAAIRLASFRKFWKF